VLDESAVSNRVELYLDLWPLKGGDRLAQTRHDGGTGSTGFTVMGSSD